MPTSSNGWRSLAVLLCFLPTIVVCSLMEMTIKSLAPDQYYPLQDTTGDPAARHSLTVEGTKMPDTYASLEPESFGVVNNGAVTGPHGGLFFNSSLQQHATLSRFRSIGGATGESVPFSISLWALRRSVHDFRDHRRPHGARRL